MTTLLKSLGQVFGRGNRAQEQVAHIPLPARPRQAGPTVEIAPDDPIIAYLQSTGGAVEIDRLNLDSPALEKMRVAGIKLVVPLVSQGVLVGLLNLGPRLSEQEYSTDDHALLNNLAAQATPAVRVAQLVRQQQMEAQERERMEQELQVARLIQQTLLPRQLPELPGWRVAVHYQPARAVGGDFYDFYERPDGRLVLAVGDVTDKGVPAALVMATTRAILRGCARRMLSPGESLVRTNELLYPEIPAHMFVTCLYAILDPASGRLEFANAGHDLPYRQHDDAVDELAATGMPLGLMPGMQYEEKEITLLPGESILLYSDGLVEAHNAEREMFGFPRLHQLVNEHCASGCGALIDSLLADLADFAGPDWEQEDDITLVTLEREMAATAPSLAEQKEVRDEKRTLAEFALPSVMGNECEAMTQVVAAVKKLELPDSQVQRLRTAVSEATMNAIEHGNERQPELPVHIHVFVANSALTVRITDQGGGRPIPEPQIPNLEAKLAGLQSPRGWGLFLIENMVDEMHVTSDESHHTVDLVLHLKGDAHANTGD
jgi:serine phosphatase RsbU (regulator of sigma subunit)/anti-sigma regulatory factor (Ser/Thr protein kinase)